MNTLRGAPPHPMARAGEPGFNLTCAGRFFVALPASWDLSFHAKPLLSGANRRRVGLGCDRGREQSQKIRLAHRRGAAAPQTCKTATFGIAKNYQYGQDFSDDMPVTSDPGSRLIRPATYASTASAALSGAWRSVDLARAGEPARLLGRERFHGGARGRVVLLEFSRWRSAALSGAVTALSRDLRRGGEDEQRGESDPGRGTHSVLLVSCGPGPPDHRRLGPSKRLCAASVRAAAPAPPAATPPPRGRAEL